MYVQQPGYYGQPQPMMIPPPGGPYGQQPMVVMQPQPVMMQSQPMMQQPVGPGMPMMGPRRGGRLNLPMMPMPDNVPDGAPPGLAYLATLDHLFIRQCVEPIENSDFCERQCCGAQRPFTMTVSDGLGSQVMRMHRPYRCSNTWCCFCCLQKMLVEAPAGKGVGQVKQRCSCCTADYILTDANGVAALRIDGPSCTCGQVEFKVRQFDGTEVGRVTKHWGGYMKEAFTDADNFGISFPINLPVQMKAVILGACFLIDFMYFETSASDQ